MDHEAFQFVRVRLPPGIDFADDQAMRVNAGGADLADQVDEVFVPFQPRQPAGERQQDLSLRLGKLAIPGFEPGVVGMMAMGELDRKSVV